MEHLTSCPHYVWALLGKPAHSEDQPFQFSELLLEIKIRILSYTDLVDNPVFEWSPKRSYYDRGEERNASSRTTLWAVVPFFVSNLTWVLAGF